jgi:hypothetical protein
MTNNAIAVIGLVALIPALSLAQNTAACGRDSSVTYGVSAIDCVQCTIRNSDVLPWIEYGAEPTVREVARGFFTSGGFVAGDIVVSIDGLPITTSLGSARFATPAAGRATRFDVRRGERVSFAQGTEIGAIVRSHEGAGEGRQSAECCCRCCYGRDGRIRPSGLRFRERTDGKNRQRLRACVRGVPNRRPHRKQWTGSARGTSAWRPGSRSRWSVPYNARGDKAAEQHQRR